MTADETILQPAAAPDGDLACDFTIAKGLADEGFRERLRSLLRRPLETLPDGVRATFEPAAWDDVRRYVEVESRCCPFLNLSAAKTGDGVVLQVTGRPEAHDLILNIFAEAAATSPCCEGDGV